MKLKSLLVGLLASLAMLVSVTAVIGVHSNPAEAACDYATAVTDGCGTCSYNSAVTDGCAEVVTCSYNDSIATGCIAYKGPTYTLDTTEDTLDTTEDTLDTTEDACEYFGESSDCDIVGPVEFVAAIGWSLAGDEVTVVLPSRLLALLDLTKDVKLQYNPTVFNGILPANGTVTFNLPASRRTIDLNVTGTLLNGATYTEVVTISRAATTIGTSPAALDIVTITNAPGSPAATATAAATPAAATTLAVTGTETDLASLLAPLLVGLGAAFVGGSRVMQGRRND